MRRLVIIAAIGFSAFPQNSAPVEIAAAILHGHNRLRAVHHVTDLVYDDALVIYAQNWASHLAATGTFEHSQGPYGENLYCLSSAAPVGLLDAAISAIDAWAGEVVFYHEGDGFSHKTGHFTQMVWKNSRRLGCATARSKRGGRDSVYVVCNYDPPGNVSGEFRRNVLP